MRNSIDVDFFDILEQLKIHEGFRQMGYICPAGKLTIGYGRNIQDKGLTKAEAEYLLKNDILECYGDMLKSFLNFENFKHSQQTALMNMRFQLGLRGLLRFKKMVKAVENDDWDEAIKEAKNSKWYRSDCPERAKEVVEMMEG